MQPYGQEYFETLTPGKGLTGLQQNACKLLDFSLLALEPGESHAFETGAREVALVMLTGTVDVRVNGLPFEKVGGRESVFAGPPALVYAPCGSSVTIIAYGRAELALCSCPSQSKIVPYRLDAKDAISGKGGRYNTSWSFNYLLDASRPSERLHIAEVTVTSGNWAVFPPHKHERNEPGQAEIFQEEMDYFRLQPADGFGLAAQYGGQGEGDYAFMVRDGSIQKIPQGFHTLTVAPGCRLWYLSLLAGDGKLVQPVVDPDYDWFSRMEFYLENQEKNPARQGTDPKVY